MSGPIYHDEILDVRELILILWHRKWLILGTTLLAAVLSFLISRFLVPERYQAAAMITVTERNTWADMELKALPNLAEADDLLEDTFEILEITNMEEDGLFDLTADAVVRSQLLLHVTAADPNLAAEAANTWAKVVSEKINALYGTSDDDLAILEDGILLAEEKWIAAQVEYENFITNSSLEIYPAQISAAQSALEETLFEVEHNQLLISDINTLAGQIVELGPEGFLDTAFHISLINLQARATAFQEIIPVQILVDEPVLNQEKAVSFLQSLLVALEEQNQNLGDESAKLEEQISELSLSFELERQLESQLKTNRDQTHGMYTSLISDLEEGKIGQAQEESHIVISSEALPPLAPVDFQILASTVFVSMSAALLTILGSVFQAWWVKKDQA